MNNLITEDYLEVIPAYGRDYKNGKDAKAAFLSGRDFQMQSIHHGGGYVSVSDFAEGVVVNVRYRKMQGVIPVTVQRSAEFLQKQAHTAAIQRQQAEGV